MWSQNPWIQSQSLFLELWLGVRVYAAGQEPESMLQEPKSNLQEPKSMLLEPESMLLEQESMLIYVDRHIGGRAC